VRCFAVSNPKLQSANRYLLLCALRLSIDAAVVGAAVRFDPKTDGGPEAPYFVNHSPQLEFFG